MAVRNPQIVSVGRRYGLTIATCVPADPESKGGSEATVRIARADLVLTEHDVVPDLGREPNSRACRAGCHGRRADPGCRRGAVAHARTSGTRA
jgi:hypothetical protein